MKRFYNRLIPTLFLTLCLIAAPLPLMATSSPAEGTGHEAAATAPASHGEAGATGHHGEAGTVTKAQLNDLFWRVVVFAVLVILLVKFTAKPLGTALSARRQQVREEIENLETRRQDAEKAYQELVAKLEGIEKDIKEIVDRAVVQAEKERVRIIEAAEKSATDITRQAEMAVQKELLDAKRLLRNEMADKAAAMAEQIIKNSLTPDDQLRIVDQYLSKVEAVQ
ncbi:MAG: ATP synthase F0 subunit B [Desulfobulbaceae bacterium]|jgi:F-type H+-transporting ATPase subunit b|nr:ATP synthase F0 subunit B [Desulfobulbaceae bacterium]